MYLDWPTSLLWHLFCPLYYSPQCLLCPYIWDPIPSIHIYLTLCALYTLYIWPLFLPSVPSLHSLYLTTVPSFCSFFTLYLTSLPLSVPRRQPSRAVPTTGGRRGDVGERAKGGRDELRQVEEQHRASSAAGKPYHGHTSSRQEQWVDD